MSIAYYISNSIVAEILKNSSRASVTLEQALAAAVECRSIKGQNNIVKRILSTRFEPCSYQEALLQAATRKHCYRLSFKPEGKGWADFADLGNLVKRFQIMTLKSKNHTEEP